MDIPSADYTRMLQQLQQEVHVWQTRPEEVTDSGRLQEYQSLLSSDERDRYQRFYFDRDRHHYLVAHALLRKALSAYVDVKPSCWKFSTNQHGRPEIASPDIAPSIRFNLTHTYGLVACVVALDEDCGIDVEGIRERGDPMAVAEKMFAPAEQQVLQGLSGRTFLDRFLTYWTLREAYCKALGVGIAHSRKDYCFVDEGDGQWAIRFDSLSGEKSHYWQFVLTKPTTEHVLAVAIHRTNSTARQIFKKFVIP